MTVIDCRTDSIVAVIRTRILSLSVAAHNPRRRKLYVGADDDYGVCVVDCTADPVVKRLDIWSEAEMLPVYCSADDKIYWPTHHTTPNRPDTISVIDCATDSIVRRIPAPSGGIGIRCIAYAPWNNRLYVASDIPYAHLLTVFDCRNDSMIGQARLGSSPSEVLCNPVDRRVYVSDYWDSAVYVFREELQPVVEESTFVIAARAVRLWPNPARDVVWLSGPVPLVLYSTCGRRLLALVPGRNELPDDLPDGVYLARRPDGTPSGKVVVRR